MFGLDAIRSAAILMVVVCHFGIMFSDWFGAVCPPAVALSGFFGVELFFVLSGFLVGRLLVDVIDAGVTWRAWAVFMTRRWLRTLPLYFLWLAVLAVVWRPYFWLPGTQPLLRALPYFMTMTQNLAWPMVENWFGVSWSLSVEEWFYIGFSSVLLAGVALVGRRWFWATVGDFPVRQSAAAPASAARCRLGRGDEQGGDLSPRRDCVGGGARLGRGAQARVARVAARDVRAGRGADRRGLERVGGSPAG